MPISRPPTLLLVDDDPVTLSEGREALSGCGCTVLTARSVEGALEVLSSGAPDAAIIGRLSKDSEAERLCQRMRDSQAGRAMPILLARRTGGPGEAREARASGADELFDPSTGMEEMSSRVKRLIHERKPTATPPFPGRTALEALASLARRLSANRASGDFHERAAEALRREMGYRLVAIGTLASSGVELRGVSPKAEAAAGGQLISSAAATGALEAGLARLEASASGGWQCWAPFGDEEGAIGVVSVAFSPEAAGGEKEAVQALEAAAGQLAIALRAHQRIALVRAHSERLASTVRERTETLERQIRFTGQIIDSLPVSLYVVDRQRRIVAWNRQRELGSKGLKRERALGRSLFEVFDQQPPEALEAELDPVFRRGESLMFERDSVADGELRHFRIRKLPMRLEPCEVTHVLTIGEDITEQRRMQKSMVVAEKMAAMGRLASGVAHEINNPLATIVTCAGGLRERLSELAGGARLSSEFFEYLDLIEQEAYRAKRITEDLLDFSRVRPSARRSQGLERILDRTLLILKHHAGFKRIVLEKQFEPSLPPIAVEEDAVVQVFVALIINALDAMPEGGTLRLRASSRGDEVICHVEDTGCGIAAADLPRIFEPFFTTKPPGRGTGLGLAVCYGILQAHGGRIEAESLAGKGSRFTVVFPAPTMSGGGEEGKGPCSLPSPSGS